MSNYNDFNKSYNPNINSNSNNDFMNNMSNENFINMAKNIDLDNLNGTNIMDLSGQNNNFSNPQTNFQNPYQNTFSSPPTMQVNNLPIPTMPSGNQDKHLIKSITRELINNLKENNISLRDENMSSQSKNKKYSNIDLEESSSVLDEDEEPTYKTKKHEYKDELKKGLEHVMVENGLPSSTSSYMFDDMFNIKEFVILFGLYFLLSQEMVKDLFAQYFTSLNPDDMGRVQVKGVIIYGLILTVLFMIFKKLV
jgi:hypothetical protein